MKMPTKVSFVFFAALFIAAGTIVSTVRNTVWFVPLDLYLTAWHEAMHAGAAWVTGGAVHEINVHAGHGTTVTSGGIFPFISMAGYFGTALWGCVLLASLRYSSLRQPVMWTTLALPCLVMLFGDGISVALALVAGLTVVLGVLWVKFGFYVGALLSLLFASESFKDIQVYLMQSPHETDAGILARYIGLPSLTLPIALTLAALTLVMWCFAMKSTMLTNRNTANSLSMNRYKANTYDTEQV